MIKIYIYFLLLSFSGLLFSQTEKMTWTEARLLDIERIPADPSAKEITILCAIASAVGKSEDHKRAINKSLQRLEKIENLDGALHQYILDGKEKWKKSGLEHEYDFARTRLIESLGSIQDPRIIKLLGTLLYDMEWTQDPLEFTKAGHDYGLTPPNGQLAAESLSKLVANSPVQKIPGQFEDVLAWKAWYESVKAGKIDFSFINAPGKYRFMPDGSWEITSSENLSSVPSPQIQAERPRLRPLSESPITHEGIVSVSDNRWMYAIAVGIILITTGWLFFTRK